MQDADVQTLKKELKGDVFAGYVPVDSNIAIKSSYLTSADSYTIIEMDTVERAGLKKSMVITPAIFMKPQLHIRQP